MSVVQKLSETPILWFSFIATVIITIAFQVAVGIWDLILLDTIVDPAQARAVVASMSGHQRGVHAWITGTLDVAYPAAYGALFIGSAYKFFPKFAWLLAAPTLVLIPIDLTEGVVQILALTGTADWLSTKAVLTNVKQILFIAGLIITICGWVKWAIAKMA